MKLENHQLFIILLVLVISSIYFFGTKKPPAELSGSEIPPIHSISIEDTRFEWNKEEKKIWESVRFDKEEELNNGFLNDYRVTLHGEEHNFLATYNIGDSLVYFNFIPEFEYGFFQKPTHKKWDLPLYTTKPTNELFQILHLDFKAKPDSI